MALKPDRDIQAYNIRNYCNEVAQKGQFMSVKTWGSGVSLDGTFNVCTAAASSSGAKPLGLLLNDVVAVDLTHFPTNWHRQQSNSGDKVPLVTKGWVVTNMIQGTPVAGDNAILVSSGNVGTTTLGAPYNQVANPTVGHWETVPDSAGYATLFVDLH